MAIYILQKAYNEGASSIPLLWPLIKCIPVFFVLWLLKTFFSGASNTSERKMHGKVVLITGGTSGVGEAIVRDLATRGAQIVLLTQHPLGDPFIVDYIDDIRRDTKNHLITAEQINLASLHSVRTFATKWIDNAPPRRLDMVILCANTLTTEAGKVKSTSEGVELVWQINYLANFHLLSILSPALRAQPPDRDVRVIIGACSSYMGGDLLHITQAPASGKNTSGKTKKQKDALAPTKFSPGNAYATSKFALTTFALAYQKHLATYKRPDNAPVTAKVLLADPGLCRTPGTRRWLTRGSLFGLMIYLITYPLWWLVLKSPDMGAQSFLHAAMEEKFNRVDGGLLIKEVKERDFLRKDVTEEETQKKLWEYSERMITEAEARGKQFRDKTKKENDEQKEQQEAEKELKDYKEKTGRTEGQRKEGGRRSKKAG